MGCLEECHRLVHVEPLVLIDVEAIEEVHVRAASVVKQAVPSPPPATGALGHRDWLRVPPPVDVRPTERTRHCVEVGGELDELFSREYAIAVRVRLGELHR